MEFFNEKNIKINHLRIERTEQLQAETYIRPDSVVLELGARYGTVSCVISKKLSDPNNLVVVEPDERVWGALESNMERNDCKFHIVKGFVSRKPLGLTEQNSFNGYGTTFAESEEATIPCFTLEEIQDKYGIRFNTLVADCEGFLERFFEENPLFYDQLNLVMFETDYGTKCNYKKIMNMLTSKGFTKCVDGSHQVWQK